MTETAGEAADSTLCTRLQDVLLSLRSQEDQEQGWHQAACLISDLSSCTVTLNAALFEVIREGLGCRLTSVEAFLAEMICGLLKVSPKETTTALLDVTPWLQRLDSRTLTDTCLALLTQAHWPASAQQVLSGLILRLPELQGSAICNTANLLCEFIRKCDLERWSERLCTLAAPESLHRLFTIIDQGEDTRRLCALDVAKTLIGAEVFSSACGARIDIAIQHSLRLLSTLIRLLERPSSLSIQSQLGETLERFGPTRLKVMELLSVLTTLPGLVQAVIYTPAFRLCTDLFFDFEWNSLLHSAYFTLLTHILTTGDYLTVIEDSGLPHHLISAEQYVCRAGRMVKTGNYGYIIRITDLMMRISEKSQCFRRVLEGVEGWTEFVRTIIEPKLEIEREKEGVMRKNSSVGVIVDEEEMFDEEEDEGEYELKDEPEE